MPEFDTPHPVRLRIQAQSGDIDVTAQEATTTTVDVRPGAGDAARELAEQTTVEQRGDDIVVRVPRRAGSFFRRTPSLDISVRLPVGSALDAELNAGDLATGGSLSTVRVKTGSGDILLDVVTDAADVATGSGDVIVRDSQGSTRLSTGSGDIALHAAGARATLATGSGDVRVRAAGGPVDIKTGSGDVRVDDAGGDVSIKSGSGDQQVGRAVRGQVSCQTASGDVHVGIADGTAAWLDVHSLTGTVSSQLGEAGPPSDSQQTVEVRANTVNGDITVVRA
ncbi:MAG: DUF4097 domain-containing protein [Actinomycetota bacterium]|nr:DUF4097 domain-containing protein [Actinomycetota bacterium]